MGRSGPVYISPTVQREAIGCWGGYRQVQISDWHHVDEDRSGST
jgi:hypothetical protein